MAFLNALSDFDAAATDAVTAPPPASNTRHKTAPAGVEPRAPFFRWREHWCVGIEALDRDHRALAAILNHMALRFGAHTIHAADAGLRTPARESGVPTALRYWLDALRERTREHFAREEALMRATHYPDTAEHASEHALMLAEYTALVRDICARGDEQLRLSDLEALKQWLLGHMLDMDKRLGWYLRENGVTALPVSPNRQGVNRQGANRHNGAPSEVQPHRGRHARTTETA